MLCVTSELGSLPLFRSGLLFLLLLFLLSSFSSSANTSTYVAHVLLAKLSERLCIVLLTPNDTSFVLLLICFCLASSFALLLVLGVAICRIAEGLIKTQHVVLYKHITCMSVNLNEDLK